MGINFTINHTQALISAISHSYWNIRNKLG